MKRKTSVVALVALVLAFGLVAGGCVKVDTDYAKNKAQNMINFVSQQDNKPEVALDQKGQNKLSDAKKGLKKGNDLVAKKDYNGANKVYIQAWEDAANAGLNLTCEQGDCGYVLLPCDSPEWKDAPDPCYADHCVAPGENLWWIASYEDYYGDPFSWPLIYAENKCEIDWEAKRRGMPKMKGDGYAHWIFPGQVLRINMTPEIEDWVWARDLAGAKCPCDLPVDCGTAKPYRWIACDSPSECLYYVDMLYDLGLITADEYEAASNRLVSQR